MHFVWSVMILLVNFASKTVKIFIALLPLKTFPNLPIFTENHLWSYWPYWFKDTVSRDFFLPKTKLVIFIFVPKVLDLFVNHKCVKILNVNVCYRTDEYIGFNI
jgi:hypothetical protein